MGNHGGKRHGAGRKYGTGKYGEATKPVRVPVSLIDDVRRFIDVRIAQRMKMHGYASPDDNREKPPLPDEL